MQTEPTNFQSPPAVGTPLPDNLTGQNSPPPNKKQVFLVAGVALAIFVFVLGGGFLWAQNAKNNYEKAAAAYKNELKQAYESIDKATPETDDDVTAAMKDSQEKLEAALKAAPKPAKLVFFSVTPADAEKEVKSLTAAASNLATAFKAEYKLATYETALNTIIDRVNENKAKTLDVDTLESIPKTWDEATKELKALNPPQAAQQVHEEIIAEFEELNQVIDSAVSYYAIPDIRNFVEQGIDLYGRAGDLSFLVADLAEVHTKNTDDIAKYFDELGKLVE